MIIIFGLVILVAAVVAGVSGVLSNSGHAHAVGHFAVFGYHVTGSTGTLFLYGIVTGAIGLLGLSVLLAGARRTSRRGRDARRGLRQSRLETTQSRQETAAVSKDRDDLIDQRETARAANASTPADGSAGNGTVRNGSGPGRARLFARRFAPPQATPEAEPPVGQAPADATPAGASAPAE